MARDKVRIFQILNIKKKTMETKENLQRHNKDYRMRTKVYMWLPLIVARPMSDNSSNVLLKVTWNSLSLTEQLAPVRCGHFFVMANRTPH